MNVISPKKYRPGCFTLSAKEIRKPILPQDVVSTRSPSLQGISVPRCVILIRNKNSGLARQSTQLPEQICKNLETKFEKKKNTNEKEKVKMKNKAHIIFFFL